MAVTRTPRNRRNAPAPASEVNLPESENTSVSTDTIEAVESEAGTGSPEEGASTESNTADAGTEKPTRQYKRPTEAIEARRRIAEYKKAEEARTLLTGLGFTVTQPEGWEHPDKVNERERAKRALAAYLAAGGSVDDLTGNGSEESTASEA